MFGILIKRKTQERTKTTPNAGVAQW